MSLQKPLCWICECPTADGAVQAVHVDKEKLQAWALNVCGHEFTEQIEDHDLICFFCVWHAQTLAGHDFEDETLVWWPRNFVLDEGAEMLLKSYLEGKVDQCWIQLEKITLPDIENEPFEQPTELPQAEGNWKKCFYCCRSFNYASHLRMHLKKVHKNAIRCENWICATYFHTKEEREKHELEVHEKPKEGKKFKCNFCCMKCSSASNLRKHVRIIHKEFPVKCVFIGCFSYFQTEAEMKLHLDSNHSQEIDEKKFGCEYCDYKTQYACNLSSHVARKHLAEKIKCNQCDKMLSSSSALQDHKRKKHMFKPCILCKTGVPVSYKSWHLRVRKCVHCNNNFSCLGLLNEHLKVCKEKLAFKCNHCPYSFKWRHSLHRHMKTKHRMKLWHGEEHKDLGFKCEMCKRYFKSAELLKSHFNYKHNGANWKRCAHCDESFRQFLQLKRHLAGKHGLIEGDFECDECKKKFVSKCYLRKHFISVHVANTRKH